MKKNIILLGSLILSSVAYSQVGIDTKEPKATLDVVVKSDKLNKPFGIIAPRVTGIELRNAGGQFNADQDGAIVYATSSAETTTGRAKNVTQRGYYYFDATLDNGSSLGLWVALKNAPADYVEPWNQAGTTTPATANGQAIYQKGAVSIWRDKVFESSDKSSAKVDLHVNGATRIGDTDPDVSKKVGANSFAGGNAAVASGNNAMAYGTSVEASGVNSAALGTSNVSSGNSSFTAGTSNNAGGVSSVALGSENQIDSTTNFSIVGGLSNSIENNSYSAVALGSQNKIYQSTNTMAAGTANIIGSKAKAKASIALGSGNSIDSDYSAAIGLGNNIGQYSNTSFALGQDARIAGTDDVHNAYNSYALGYKATVGYDSVGGETVTGANSAYAIGSEALANGKYSYAIGYRAKAKAYGAIAIGTESNINVPKVASTVASERNSIAIGSGIDVSKPYNTAIGSYNIAGLDASFAVGIGNDIDSRKNGLMVFNNGKAAIGSYSSAPSFNNGETLQVNGGALADKAYVKDINNVTGAPTDKLVVADANTGQLKTISATGSAVAYKEPWKNQADETDATTDTQNIYQRAAVAIMKKKSYSNGNWANLDVAGAVRTGDNQTGTVGANSVAMGNSNTASGANSVAMGNSNTASGANSVAMGNSNTASGNNSLATGNITKATGFASTSLGEYSEAASNYSLSAGYYNKTSNPSETALGAYNLTFPKALFTIGDGLGTGNNDASITRSNIISAQIASNGNFVAIGSGTVEPSKVRDETLRVYGGALADKAYVKYINSEAGAATDKLVVADPNTGQLKTITASSLPNATYQEPWNQAGTTTPATANNQPIYQKGAVSIWRDKVFKSTDNSSAKVDLHVNGATRIGATDPDVSVKVGESSFAGGNAPVASGNNAMAFGTSVVASGVNSFAMGDQSTAAVENSAAFGFKTISSGVNSFAMGDQSTAFGVNSAAFGNNSKAVGTESIAMGNNTTATGAQSFAGGGNGSTATGQYAFAFGSNAQAKANHAVAMGIGTVAPARSSVTLGRYNVNTFTSPDIAQNSPGEPIFQVGSGPDDARRYNIITTYLGTNGTTGVGGGWMAIGGELNTMPKRFSTESTETLRVYGGVNATSYAVGSTTLTVPDYVFQKYYTGTSTLKNDYNFMSNLYDVEKFLKENHHLPGITSAKEIQKKGYYKIEDMQMQNLEKTEELYLHVIEQQKQIDELKDIVKKQQEQIKQFLSK